MIMSKISKQSVPACATKYYILVGNINHALKKWYGSISKGLFLVCKTWRKLTQNRG